MNVIDFAARRGDVTYEPAPRDHLSERLHRLQRACRRVIATEPGLTPEQRLSLLIALDDELEIAGL